MIETPQVIDTGPARGTTLVCVHCPRDGGRRTMGRSVRELPARIRAQGAQPMGPLFTHHLRGPTDSFGCEVGVLVSRPVSRAGHVYPGLWPAMHAARALYRGRYEDLPRAWSALHAWTAAQGLTGTGELWECYITGPEIGSDASAWRTELYLPLCDVAGQAAKNIAAGDCCESV